MTNNIFNFYSALGESGSFLSFAITIASIAGLWKMFDKAGEPGWAALVPMYNVYKLCQISIGNGWLCLLALIGIIPLVGWIAALVLLYLLAVNTAKAFGKTGGWAVGLFFLAPIFYCLLGFGDADYYGPQGIGDNRPDEAREAQTVDFEVIKNDDRDDNHVDFDVK